MVKPVTEVVRARHGIPVRYLSKTMRALVASGLRCRPKMAVSVPGLKVSAIPPCAERTLGTIHTDLIESTSHEVCPC